MCQSRNNSFTSFKTFILLIIQSNPIKHGSVRKYKTQVLNVEYTFGLSGSNSIREYLFVHQERS